MAEWANTLQDRVVGDKTEKKQKSSLHKNNTVVIMIDIAEQLLTPYNNFEI